jgi:hypothetical protein
MRCPRCGRHVKNKKAADRLPTPREIIGGLPYQHTLAVARSRELVRRMGHLRIIRGPEA